MVRIQTPHFDGYPKRLIIGRGTTVTTEDGAEVKGVHEITVHISADKFVTADLRVFGRFDGIAYPRYVLVHPTKGGEPRAVKRVEFADGEIWED
jgi:hypothetical protein